VNCRFFDSIKPEANTGIIIMNPPYGMRLEERGELKDLYRSIGDTLKQNFTGYDAWVITPSMDTFKFIGLRPARRIPLYNGPIETRFLKFEVYQGSKRYGEENRDVSDRPRSDRGDNPRRDSAKDRTGERRSDDHRSERSAFNKNNDRKPFDDKRESRPSFDRKGDRSLDDKRKERPGSWKTEEKPGDSERRREWEQSDYAGRRRIRSFINNKPEEGKKPTKRKHRRPRTDEL
jgi:hypothetical protein